MYHIAKLGDKMKSITEIRYFFNKKEFDKIQSLYIKSDMVRLNTLNTIVQAQSGHIGASFSAIEMMVFLYHHHMKKDDVFILSKGHAAAALYAVLASKGHFHESMLMDFRKLHGLQGHVDVSVPGIHANTGSLGMGLSKAVGHAWANRKIRVFVMVGDGELQEGQNWEAIQLAAHLKLDNLYLIVDRNEVQTDKNVADITSIEPLMVKLEDFRWNVAVADGHDIGDIEDAFQALDEKVGRPKAIISNTIKGYGIKFMESGDGTYKWHSGIPTEKEYLKAHKEIQERLPLQQRLDVSYPKKQPNFLHGISLKGVFSRCLLKYHNKVVVLDADLSEDCGLRPFEETYPERFIECGIAEQNMVSMAGSIAKSGVIPVVNTYTAFLTSRANEQIYNNCSEHDKVLYVGHLAGVLPAKPGKSHSGTRDISLLQSIPDLQLCAPANAVELRAMMKILIKDVKTASYMRLEHTPPRHDVNMPKGYKLRLGQGTIMNEGKSQDIVIITYGPLMLSECIQAGKMMKRIRVINLPWLNNIDAKWLKKAVGRAKYVFCVENHSIYGGQSVAISKIMPVKTIGVEGWTQSGDHERILWQYGLDFRQIVRRLNE